MAANPNHKKKSVVCKQITCHAAKSSITCLDWDPLNHKVIVTGSDDKTVKFWDIDQISSCNEKYIVNIDCSKYGEVTCVRLNDKLHKIWVATNDCNVYEFDTRNIKNNQVKCLCKCEDEINDIKYDSIKNCLLIGDDTGSITKYNLADDTSNSVKLHENSVCTSLALSNISAFSGGTDASILQFDSTLNAESMFDPIYCYSVTEMIENTSKNQSQNGASWINPPFVYSLDILPTDNIKSVYLSMALGNGSVAIFKPQLIEENTSNDKSEEKEKSKETDTDAPDEPVSFVSLHKQACCKAYVVNIYVILAHVL